MTWEIAAAWAGVVVTAIIGFLANIRSGAATKAAAEALAASQSMAASLDKIAQELARHGGSTPPAAAATAMAPAPAWNIEYRGGQAFALRNVGAGTATHVTIASPSGIGPQLAADDDVTLEPAQAHSFALTGTSHSPMPTHVLVTCAELAAERVPIPPGTGRA